MINEKKFLDRIEKNSFLLWFIFLLGSLFFKSMPITIGLLSGGAFIIINFHLLRKIIEKAFKHERKRIPLLAFSFFLKFAFLVGGIGVFVLKTEVNIISFIIGISILFMTICLEGLIFKTLN